MLHRLVHPLALPDLLTHSDSLVADDSRHEEGEDGPPPYAGFACKGRAR